MAKLTSPSIFQSLEQRLVRDWRIVIRRSWSFWGNILLSVASGVAGGFSYDGTFYWTMAIANLAVAALRLTLQKGFDDAD